MKKAGLVHYYMYMKSMVIVYYHIMEHYYGEMVSLVRIQRSSGDVLGLIVAVQADPLTLRIVAQCRNYRVSIRCNIFLVHRFVEITQYEFQFSGGSQS